MILTRAFMQTAREFGPIVVFIGPFIVPVLVFLLTRSFYNWQQKLEQAKLRFQLYDRRLPIYHIFLELLQALPEKGDDEIEAAFRKTALARLEVPFLFGDDPDLEACVEQICTRVNELVITNNVDLEIKPFDVLFDHDNPRAEETKARIKQYGAAKLKIHDDYLPQLAEKFGASLRLTDFSKNENRHVPKGPPQKTQSCKRFIHGAAPTVHQSNVENPSLWDAFGGGGM